ncbi:MAG: hypothetical protein K0R70_788 [Steroidobacteraceae bacterium]|nr:hypothetical protein [Steroidobacteraceae bacterium]
MTRTRALQRCVACPRRSCGYPMSRVHPALTSAGAGLACSASTVLQQFIPDEHDRSFFRKVKMQELRLGAVDSGPAEIRSIRA